MPVVYVHGVGNREGGRYNSAETVRTEMFRRFFCPAVFSDPQKVAIISPYWGRHGARPAWGLASLPFAAEESFGVSDDAIELLPYGLTTPPSRPETVLVEVARRSLTDAVDLLCATMSQPTVTALIDDLATVVSYCEEKTAARPWGSEQDRYPWLADTPDDVALVDRLSAEVADWSAATPAAHESFGGGSRLRDTLADQASRLRRSMAARLTRPVADGARRLFGANLSTFIGDVMVYLAQRGTRERPGRILCEVQDALDSAVRARATADPVVVVAHSMGGNIAYDLLSYYRTDIEVDVLVTVGSQVGFFEELGLFQASQAPSPGTARTAVPCPGNIKRWINVVDRSDILGYRTSPVFSGIDDYDYRSGAGWAHTAYFRQPFFYRRMAARIRESS